MNNPYAFPKVGGSHHVEQDGMTLRDYFAAKAMAAFITRAPLGEWMGDEELAKFSYETADQMLVERESK